MPVTQAAPSRTPDVLRIDTRRYLSLVRPERLRSELVVEIDAHCFLPRVEELDRDWLAHVAVPSFRTIRDRRGEAVRSFCSIGTGAGLDVLAGIEILGARVVGLTDVHDGVVSAAMRNVRRNVLPEHPVDVHAGCGDLLEPLRFHDVTFDVIYENLPNVPAGMSDEVAAARTSSTHVSPRAEPIPPEIRRQMLDLHYLALLGARPFLAPGGSILSMLGARVPLEVLLRLGAAAGLRSSFLRYTWKIQAEGETVIRDHAARQREGFGPFHFYPAALLRERFAIVDAATAGERALELEGSLAPERLDAIAAWEAFRRGEEIGHTAVALESVAP